MKEIKTGCTKGTRVLLGNKKREIINKMIEILLAEGFEEISIPIIQESTVFYSKVGGENQEMMYTFEDYGGRDLCLAPEYTAVIMNLAKTEFKQQKDVKLFYLQECFRGEKPQAGRYRQFTQLGVEILNPTVTEIDVLREMNSIMLLGLAGRLLHSAVPKVRVKVNRDVIRGLDYYKGGKGFEIIAPQLGAQKQIVGGGVYPGGVGFAVGIDRLILLI